MKKTFLLITGVFILASFGFTQEPIRATGEKVINIGTGLGSVLYTGAGYSTTLTPVFVFYEQIILDEIIDKGQIGVGGYLGFATYKWDSQGFGSTWGWNYSNIVIGARGTFHYPLIENLDTYSGLFLGYQIVSVSEFGVIQSGYTPHESRPIWSLYIGGRYFFTEKFAGMIELGYGITFLNLGLSMKL